MLNEGKTPLTLLVIEADVNRLVLTNRHVVGPGPFSGYIVFNNQEEVEVHPIYRDPIHDFGFLKFDPKKVKYMQLTAMQLRPDLAKGKSPEIYRETPADIRQSELRSRSLVTTAVRSWVSFQASSAVWTETLPFMMDTWTLTRATTKPTPLHQVAPQDPLSSMSMAMELRFKLVVAQMGQRTTSFLLTAHYER
jgi:hypothetical protein